MLKNNKKGFTLIEIIVVVVILAVLMAVAVPSVLKYIDTAQEAPALTEAHAIVTAAQKKVIEKYSQTRDENVILDDNDNKWIEEFVGEGGTVQGSITVTNKEVTRLLYQASNGLLVLYENQEYKILDEEAFDINTVSGYLRYLQKLASDKELDKITNGNANEIAKNRTKSLQKEFYESNGNKYPTLTNDEKKMLTSRLYKDVDTLCWKPLYDTNGGIVLIADIKTAKGEAIGAGQGPLIYYNNEYYYHRHSAAQSNQATSTHIKESQFILNEEWVKVS